MKKNVLLFICVSALSARAQDKVTDYFYPIDKTCSLSKKLTLSDNPDMRNKVEVERRIYCEKTGDSTYKYRVRFFYDFYDWPTDYQVEKYVSVVGNKIFVERQKTYYSIDDKPVVEESKGHCLLLVLPDNNGKYVEDPDADLIRRFKRTILQTKSGEKIDAIREEEYVRAKGCYIYYWCKGLGMAFEKRFKLYNGSLLNPETALPEEELRSLERDIAEGSLAADAKLADIDIADVKQAVSEGRIKTIEDLRKYRPNQFEFKGGYILYSDFDYGIKNMKVGVYIGDKIRVTGYIPDMDDKYSFH